MHLVVLFVGTLLLVSILGIIIAFSPTLLITELAVLTRSKRPGLQTLVLITGIASAITLFCLIAVLFVDPSHSIRIPSTREIVRNVPVLDGIVGILLIIISLKLLRPSPLAVPLSERGKSASINMSSKALYLFGFIKTATSLSTIAAILVAARLIKTSLSTSGLQFMAVVWLIAFAILPFVLIIILRNGKPEVFHKLQALSDRAASLNWRKLASIVLLLLGTYFIVNSIVHWN